jgi:hypothetical protein
MADTSGKRDRSPSFPQIPLSEAVERLIGFENYFGRHPAPIEKAGLAWGLKQVDHILAALRYYGFTEYAGHGGARQVTLSQDGRNLLRAQQELTRQEILKRAALRPKEIAKFWQSWGADRPPDPVCIEELSMRNGFSDRGARLFLRTYDATIAFAELGDSDKIPPDTQDDDAESRGSGKHEDELPPNPPPPPADQRRVRIMEGERIVFTEEGQPNQYLKLIASGPIDDGLLEALEDFVKRQRRRVNSALHRDRERWQAELVKFEEAGLGDSDPAETIRGWIKEAGEILDDS